MRKNIFVLAILIAFVFAFTGCSGDKTKTVTLPEVQVYLNETLVQADSETINNMVSGDKILIIATHADGIKTTNFRVGTGDLQSLKESKIQVVVPDSYAGAGKFSLNVYAESETGLSSLWAQYIFEMKTK